VVKRSVAASTERLLQALGRGGQRFVDSQSNSQLLCSDNKQAKTNHIPDDSPKDGSERSAGACFEKRVIYTDVRVVFY
jgi:hypothetical protein